MENQLETILISEVKATPEDLSLRKAEGAYNTAVIGLSITGLLVGYCLIKKLYDVYARLSNRD